MIDTEGLDARDIRSELREVDVTVEAMVTLAGLRTINVGAQEAEGEVSCNADDLFYALDAEGLLTPDIIATYTGAKQ